MKYTLRFVWYVLRIVIVTAAAFAILVVAFFIAMDSANVYVIVTDGMKARATQALLPGQTQTVELKDFFTDSFLQRQPAIDTSKYVSFALTAIDYKLDVESLWCKPWQNTATVTVVESIPKMTYTEPSDVQEGKEKPVLPQWQRARYKIFCVRRNDAWRIDSIEKVEDLLPEPTPTPEPTTYITASPLPTTAAPSASVTASAGTSPTPTPAAK